MVNAIVPIALTVLLAIVDFAEASWRVSPDPTWETRWKALDPTESAWLAQMARSRRWLATLTDPEEIALARGFYRRERRHRVYFDLAALPFLAAAVALTLAGVLSTAVLASVFLTFPLVHGIAVYRRERHIHKAYQEAKATYQALTAAS